MAAPDLALHGPRLIVVEFPSGIAISLVLGVLFLVFSLLVLFGRSPSAVICSHWRYVPLLIHALLLGSGERAEGEAAAESYGGAAGYSLKSLLLLVPLVVPAFAVVQGI